MVVSRVLFFLPGLCSSKRVLQTSLHATNGPTPHGSDETKVVSADCNRHGWKDIPGCPEYFQSTCDRHGWKDIPGCREYFQSTCKEAVPTVLLPNWGCEEYRKNDVSEQKLNETTCTNFARVYLFPYGCRKYWEKTCHENISGLTERVDCPNFQRVYVGWHESTCRNGEDNCKTNESDDYRCFQRKCQGDIPAYAYGSCIGNNWTYTNCALPGEKFSTKFAANE